jgi:hypothetical protein
MSDFTVVLLRPDYLHDTTQTAPGQDIYVAFVAAEGYREAVKAAREQAFKADTEDMEPRALDDYTFVVMFDGHQEPRLFGWQCH